MKSAGPVLIVGYGNTLRSDDGLGPRVAEAIGDLELPGVSTMACAQLTPEMAEPISRASLVIFIDAALDEPSEVRFERIVPGPLSRGMTHGGDPATMLALARDVFGGIPESWLLRIPAENLELGEQFSPTAQCGFRAGVEMIKRVLEQGKPPCARAHALGP
jgi:hydrogenase maturation protease